MGQGGGVGVRGVGFMEGKVGRFVEGLPFRSNLLTLSKNRSRVLALYPFRRRRPCCSVFERGPIAEHRSPFLEIESFISSSE